MKRLVKRLIVPPLLGKSSADDATVTSQHHKRDAILTVLAIGITFFASIMVAMELGSIFLELLSTRRWSTVVGHALFIVIVGFLVYGAFVYQFTRLAFLYRCMRHRPAMCDELEYLYDKHIPSLSILVPSYREDERVVYLTLMSAAFQDYPKRNLVLLIDDAPSPSNKEDAAQLQAARRLPGRIQELLAHPRKKFSTALEKFIIRKKHGAIDLHEETRTLIDLLLEAAQWFEAQAERHTIIDHADNLFIEKVLKQQFHAHRERAMELQHCLYESRLPSIDTLWSIYRKLAALFTLDISSFERKRYNNLSHEPNKAMNLNSYIALTGGHFHEMREAGALYLIPANPDEAQLHVPDADYFITLDADSIILKDYALRLIHIMQQPSNERLAVAQTPYSAIPNAPGALERIAGATTDIQYLIHQGFTGYDATYWVGANALLRKTALNDIAITEKERGFLIKKYIQDRTVIEDTESSIDLIDKGWKLYNYPERLAYSATPPDFGSLIIQRRRWANGGLIILPKLLSYLFRGPKCFHKLTQGLFRFHYLTSITAVNLGLVIILAVPFTESIHSLWLPMTAIPYFLLYMHDLSLIGYRKSDLFRVYALNLLLIPVNLGGVFKSLQQAWTKEKIPFCRTPKVEGRTSAAPIYIIAAYLLILQWSIQSGIDVSSNRFAHGVFAFMNAGFLLYAIVKFIGLKESIEDIVLGWRMHWYQKDVNKIREKSRPIVVTRDFIDKHGIRVYPYGKIQGVKLVPAELQRNKENLRTRDSE